MARIGGVTRARITQLMALTLLAPDTQEELLFLPRVARGGIVSSWPTSCRWRQRWGGGSNGELMAVSAFLEIGFDDNQMVT